MINGMKTSPRFLTVVAALAFAANTLADPVLFVVNDTNDATAGVQLGAGDTAALNRLNALGHTVTLVDDLASTTADALGKNLVIVSSTVASGNVTTKFRDVVIPVINWEQALYDDFLMTGNVDAVTRGTIAGQTQLDISTSAHPITLGISTGVQTVTTAADTFTFGQPNANADVLARQVGDASRAMIFVYERGDLLIDDLTAAPALRVGFFLQDNAANVLNSTGGQLFDNTVRYALIPEPSSLGLIAVSFAGLFASRRRIKR